MSILRPGGLELTGYALQQAGVQPGGALLEVGCGDGTAAAYIQREFHQLVTAIDIDEAAVAKAREKGVDARIMDASALEFDVCGFDTVTMECVFTALERQEEAIHEAYCMLKPGGNLILSDLYCRHPDMDRWEQDYWAAMAQFRKPRLHANCGKIEHIPSPYCQDGAVVLKGLTDLLEELELKVALLEDRTRDLQGFAAQAIMECGSLEAWFAEHGSWKPCACAGKDVGYFLLIAHKGERNA